MVGFNLACTGNRPQKPSCRRFKSCSPDHLFLTTLAIFAGSLMCTICALFISEKSSLQSRYGQFDSEDRALVYLAFCIDCSAVGFDNSFSHGQAKTQSLSFGSEQWRKELLQSVSRNPHSGVGESELHYVAFQAILDDKLAVKFNIRVFLAIDALSLA